MPYERSRITPDDRRDFWVILIPVIVQNFINALFGIMDTVMLGHTPNSAEAIAAVGVTAAPINLVVCVVSAFCIGITVRIAQLYGCGKTAECGRVSSEMLGVMAAVGLALVWICAAGSGEFMALLGANTDIRADAADYFRIVAYGYFFQTVTIAVTAAFCGIGETKLPMFYNIFSGLLNVLLNYCLIDGHFGFPALRVAGAAWATTASKGAAFLFAMGMLFRKDSPLRVRSLRELRPTLQTIVSVLRVGISSGAEQLILQSGAVITTKIITVIPTVPFAAYQVSTSLEGIIWALSGGFCTASTTLAGRYYGRGDPEKAEAAVRMIWHYGLVCGLLVALVYVFLGLPVAELYTTDPYVAQTAAGLLRISSVMLFGVFTHQAVAGGMRGMNHPNAPLVASMVSLWVCRAAGCYLSVRVLSLGVYAVTVCCTCDQLVRGGLNLVFFRRLTRRKHSAKE